MLATGGLPVRVSGNIGNPLSAQVETSTAETVHVVEVSSFQLEMTRSFHPWMAVVLNLSPDHLDRHPDFAAYAGAKARIVVNQTADDWVVVNGDDPGALAIAAGSAACQCRFALDAPLEDGVVVAGDTIVRRSPAGDRRLLPLAAVCVPGRHLLSDVLAASAAADLAGVPAEAMAAAVSAFTGLEHAMEVVAEIDGVRFVNDSKATNVDAARHSVESFGAGLVPIFGGVFKGGDLGILREALAGRARAAVLIGDSRARFHAALEGAVPVREAASMEEAVREAFAAAHPEGTVLLAPACASFDMFRDYAERGRVFKDEVRRLVAEAEGEGSGER